MKRVRGINMPVAPRRLAMDEESLQRHQAQTVLRSRHRDIEQPAFLLYLGCRARREIGGDAAVDGVKHEDRTPLLALRT